MRLSAILQLYLRVWGDIVVQNLEEHMGRGHSHRVSSDPNIPLI